MYEDTVLRDPSLAVELMSVHDGTVIDCRLHYPARPPIGRNVAALAHPYAPMGGCSDDPVLSIIGGRLLEQGFIVATFNFRGAGCSGGKTSWTANPERDDYASVIAFLVHYMHLLRIPRTPTDTSKAATSQPGRETAAAAAVPPLLLMGGYSYGAMITTRLPSLHHLMEPFCASPNPSPHASQIRSEAARAAGILNRTLRVHPDLEAYTDNSYGLPEDPPSSGLTPSDAALLRTAYLLISPPAPRGFVTALTTLSLIPAALTSVFARRGPGNNDENNGNNKMASAKASQVLKLVQNRTLVVYGGADALISVGKLRAWAQDLAARPGSFFRCREIESAGHFWSEEGALPQLVEAVDGFVKDTIVHREC